MKIVEFLRDHKNQLSWGRFCAAVALVVAIICQFTGADVEHVVAWLSVAVGNYVASKVAEFGNRSADAQN